MLLWSKKAIEKKSPFLENEKSLMQPVVLYGAETWTLTSSDEQALDVFERKRLRQIDGPFCDRAEYKLYDIHDVIDVVKRIKIPRIRWLDRVLRMDSCNPVR